MTEAAAIIKDFQFLTQMAYTITIFTIPSAIQGGANLCRRITHGRRIIPTKEVSTTLYRTVSLFYTLI
jgi:hypothetical protein